ncbi:hypothetical protein TrispH2_004200 [Trichoplax sp. H2]|nr:hypothetical protein TrispH2_004200 [Trichoplax sp. H2]|eukprot:RDD43962.1 hypothetical protein TrispH2_004200 [Trichoplax sp. H2]
MAGLMANKAYSKIPSQADRSNKMQGSNRKYMPMAIPRCNGNLKIDLKADSFSSELTYADNNSFCLILADGKVMETFPVRFSVLPHRQVNGRYPNCNQKFVLRDSRLLGSYSQGDRKAATPRSSCSAASRGNIRMIHYPRHVRPSDSSAISLSADRRVVPNPKNLNTTSLVNKGLSNNNRQFDFPKKSNTSGRINSSFQMSCRNYIYV